MTHRLNGACHCGAIGLELTLPRPPEEEVVGACQCSFCRKHNARTVSDPKAQARLDELVEKYSKSASKLSRWMEDNITEGFTVFQQETKFRKRLRTSNMCENLNLQVKRRTRVAGLFPNEASVLRLVTAVLMEISEEWETGRAYLSVPGQS